MNRRTLHFSFYEMIAAALGGRGSWQLTLVVAADLGAGLGTTLELHRVIRQSLDPGGLGSSQEQRSMAPGLCSHQGQRTIAGKLDSMYR